MPIQFLVDESQKEIEKVKDIVKQIKKPQGTRERFLRKFVLSCFKGAKIIRERREGRKIIIPKNLIPVQQAIQRPMPPIKLISRPLKRKIIPKIPPKPQIIEIKLGMAKAKINHEYKLFEPPLVGNEQKALENLSKKNIKKLREEKFLEKETNWWMKKFKAGEEFKKKLKYYLKQVAGFGKVEPLLLDKEIKEIICDTPNNFVRVVRNGKKIITNIKFKNAEEMNKLIVKIGELAKKKVSAKEPMLDVTLNNINIKATFGTAEVAPKFVITR